MTAITVSLAPELDAFVRAQVDAGYERSPENVIENALWRLRAERDADDGEDIDWLRAVIVEGLDSGPAEPMDWNDLRRRVRERLNSPADRA